MKIRIRFRKWGCMKYVGHLDMMRYFQRAIRRAGIDIAYTEGYSPHQIMSFASPLGVGLTSDGEYIDIEVNSSMPSEMAVQALNGQMADGTEVASFRKLPDDIKSAMSVVFAADYRISFAEEINVRPFEKMIDAFLQQPEILYTKKTKKGTAVVDLKPMIYELRAENENCLFMRIASGSSVNCKPEAVLEAMAAFEDAAYEGEESGAYQPLSEILSEKPYAVYTHRIELYSNRGTSEEPVFCSLEEAGEEIV